MDLSVLNEPQRRAVLSTEGPLLVLAGAGSGKTRVITHRIAHLLSDKKVSPRAILAVTFTNKAASEMRERVLGMAGQKALGVTLSTFHAFGAEILKAHLHKLGWPKKFAIADSSDQVGLVKRAMRERQIDDRSFDAWKVHNLISKAKNSRIEPQPKPEGMGDDYDLAAHLVYPLYQLGLKAMGAVDFDDLIVMPSVILEQFPEVRAQLVSRFRYIMVDEYQDTNRAQLALLKHLAGEQQNMCVVGDDDQCIYTWRGAEVRNMLDFEKHFPGGQEIRLEQNYRSTQVILDAANAVVEKNPERRHKKMWTDLTAGMPVSLVVAPTEEDEARYVASEIRRALEEGVRAEDIAVLYRTNGQAEWVEEFLRTKSVHYDVVGGSALFDRREVKDVIAYFKVIANPKDEISLLRIVNAPTRGIGDVTVEKISEAARASGVPIWQQLQAASEVAGLTAGSVEAVLAFVELIERYRKQFAKGNLAALTEQLLKETGFLEWARAQASSAAAGDRKVRGVKQILESLRKYEQREGPKATLLTYLNRLALDSKEEEEDHEHHLGRVSLMTLHAAKGLEWKVVFLIGMEEDLLPHSGMKGEPPNLEEERRLCYVGMTRARERLVLTRAAARMRRAKDQPRTPSRFLGDIPGELVEKIELASAAPDSEKPAGESFFAGLKKKLQQGGDAGGEGRKAQ